MIVVAPDQITQKACKYCAYQERSQQEVRDKLYSWGLHKEDVEQTIAVLVTEGYINEERFAIAYAGGKFRMKQWGKVKIKRALQQKKVSPYCIKKALAEIGNNDYRFAVRKLIASHEKKIKGNNPLKKKYQIAQYLIGKGFETELVWNELGGDM